MIEQVFQMMGKICDILKAKHPSQPFDRVGITKNTIQQIRVGLPGLLFITKNRQILIQFLQELLGFGKKIINRLIGHPPIL